MQWSSDSAVLALWLRDLSRGAHTDSSPKEGGEEGTGGQLPRTFSTYAAGIGAVRLSLGPSLLSAVQLWCVGNYHWYLKQELHLTPPPVAPTRWL